MTLSIAGKYPWGIMKNLPGGSGPKAIIFATDSRFTDLLSGITSDIGPKLIKLSGNAGVVYAGSVLPAFECIKNILQNSNDINYNNSKEAIVEIENHVRRKYIELTSSYTGESLALHLLIGIYDLDDAKLYRLLDNSSPPFKAVEIEGLYAIGSNPYIQGKFTQEYEIFFQERLSKGGGVNDNPLEFLNFINIVLDKSIISSGIAPYVGGIIQTAMITRNGFSWIEKAVIKPDFNNIIRTIRRDNKWYQIDKNDNIIQETDPSHDPSARDISKISE